MSEGNFNETMSTSANSGEYTGGGSFASSSNNNNNNRDRIVVTNLQTGAVVVGPSVGQLHQQQQQQHYNHGPPPATAGGLANNDDGIPPPGNSSNAPGGGSSMLNRPPPQAIENDEDGSMADDGENGTGGHGPTRRRRPGEACNQLTSEFRGLTEHFDVVMRKLRDEGKALQDEKAEMNLTIDKERQQLHDSFNAEREKVEFDKAQLKAMAVRATKYSDDKVVKLNVGGLVYTTTVATLCADSGSMLAAMFAEGFYLDKNENDEVTIDRDGTHFPLILDHLRKLRAWNDENNRIGPNAANPSGSPSGLPEATGFSPKDGTPGDYGGGGGGGSMLKTSSTFGSTSTEFQGGATAGGFSFPKPLEPPMGIDAIRDELLGEVEFYGLQHLQRLMQRHSLIVSQDGSSRYKRVSEALQDARDGDRIMVKPGTYYDSFTLLHSVEVVGDGPREQIVIRSPFGNVVECRCKSGVVRGLTLVCFPQDTPNGLGDHQGGGGVPGAPAGGGPGGVFGDFYGVYISEGSLVLQDCEVKSVGLSCVKVVGGPKSGKSIIRGNDIHSAHQCGILLANYAEALIQHNSVHHNRFSGVEIRNGAKPSLQGNKIFENVQNGVYIHSHGEGTVEGNHLFKNKFNGINGEGNVIVSNNVIHENLKRGIFYGQQMTLQSNEVYWNSLGDFAPRR